MIIDERGRLFGRINLIDAICLAFVALADRLSTLHHSRDRHADRKGDRVSRRQMESAMRYGVAVLLVVVFVGGACTAARQQQVKHALVVSDVALYKACEVVRAGLDEAYAAEALTREQYQDARAKLALVYDAGGAFTIALQAWRPGETIPASMADLARVIGDVRRFVLSLPAGSTRDKIITALTRAESTILDLLVP